MLNYVYVYFSYFVVNCLKIESVAVFFNQPHSVKFGIIHWRRGTEYEIHTSVEISKYRNINLNLATRCQVIVPN